MPTTQPGMDAYTRYIESLGGAQNPVYNGGFFEQQFLLPQDFTGMSFNDFSALLNTLNYQPAQQQQQPNQLQGGLNDALAAIQARMQGQQAGGGRPAGSYGPGLDAFRNFNPIRGGGSLYQSGPPQAPQFGAAPWLRGGGLLQQQQQNSNNGAAWTRPPNAGTMAGNATAGTRSLYGQGGNPAGFTPMSQQQIAAVNNQPPLSANPLYRNMFFGGG